MCLNCLPTFEKCLFCISLRDAVLAIYKVGILLYTPPFIIAVIKSPLLGIVRVDKAVDFSVWFIVIMGLWTTTSILLMIVACGCVKNDNAVDMLLQVYFWLMVVTGIIHLMFCITFLVFCWKVCFSVALIHFAALIIHILEVGTCCLCINLRMGMLLISVLCIMTGVTLLCITEQRTGASFNNLKNVTEVNGPNKIVSGLVTIIPVGLSGMSAVFMFVGLVLLLAVLSDQEGLVQVFVWVTFLNVVVGFILVAAVGFECMALRHCLLQEMDWLSASGVLVMIISYLFLWIYFIIVANSYVLNVFV